MITAAILINNHWHYTVDIWKCQLLRVLPGRIVQKSLLFFLVELFRLFLSSVSKYLRNCISVCKDKSDADDVRSLSPVVPLLPETL